MTDPSPEPGRSPEADPARAAARRTGDRVRREVLGDAHVDRALAASTAFTEPFQDFLTRSAWGDVWARPGLDRRTRSAVTLAALTALHCREEIGMHVRAALRNGLTPAEIGEVLLHTALYAGLPAANEAFAIAQAVIAEEDVAGEGLGGSVEPVADGDGQTGENTCPRCAGTGRTRDGPCPACGGTGTVPEVVGDA
jgi:4-carboxymuconolactone decarboxylase